METVSARLDLETLSLFEKLLDEKRSFVVRELVEAGKKHKAAKLAGVTLSEFIDLLKEHNVSLNLEIGDVEKALETVRKVL